MTKTVKRVVVHPKLYMAVEGKLQLVPVGTELTLTTEQAERLGKKVVDPAEQKKLVKGKMVEGSESEAVAALTAELEASKAETVKVTKALTDTATKLDVSEKALKAATKK